jgi:hypothetical protein
MMTLVELSRRTICLLGRSQSPAAGKKKGLYVPSRDVASFNYMPPGAVLGHAHSPEGGGSLREHFSSANSIAN